MYRKYLINGGPETREYFVGKIHSELTLEQQGQLLSGEVSISGSTYQIANVAGI